MKAEHSHQARLKQNFNYKKGLSFSDILDVHYYESKGRFFHTVDGRFARVWQLAGYPADTLSVNQRLWVTDGLGKVINRFPERASGQLIRYTHSDIEPMVARYLSDSQATGFERDIVDYVVKRQRQGAREGFVSDISRDDIVLAEEELLQEGELDPDRREALLENIERSMTTGRYAYMTELYLIFMYTPVWLNRMYMVESHAKRMLGELGLYNIKDDYRRTYEEEREKFFEYCLNIENTAATYGFQPSRLSGQALVNVLYRELNPIRSRFVRPPEVMLDFTVREQLDIARTQNIPDLASEVTYSNLTTKNDGWEIDGMHYKVTSAKSLPKKIPPGLLYDALRQIDGENWAVINFNVPSQGGVRFMLKTRKSALNANPLQHIPFFASDPTIRDEKETDIQTTLTATNVENLNREIVVDASVFVVVKNEDESVARTNARNLTDLMWGKGLQERMRGDAMIHQTIPMNYRISAQTMVSRDTRCLSSNLGDLAPVFTAYNGVDSPGMLVNNEQGAPIFIDLFFSEKNAAHFVTQGGTGSGKSFLFNNILMQMKKYVPKIFIVDKGGSYKDQCITSGGAYVELALSEEPGIVPTCLNPLYLKRGNRLDEVSQEFMRDIIVAMMRSGTSEDVSKDDANTVLVALKAVFDRREENQEIVLSDVHRELDTNYGDQGKRIARRFVEYTAGNIYGRMFDGKLGLSWDADMIVFEIQRVAASKSMPVIMMTLFQQVNTYCKWELPKPRYKVFAIDEAWAVLADPVAATTIAGFYREMRKYKCAVGLISQTIKDFAQLVAADRSSSGGILENTRHFFLLASAATDHESGKELLNLSDEELASWQSVASLPPYFSECFYRMFGEDDRPHSGKFRLYSNPLALWTATSSPDDHAKKQETIAEFNKRIADPDEARRAALLHLSEKYPRGFRYHQKQQLRGTR